jgi:hypothetical protein
MAVDLKIIMIWKQEWNDSSQNELLTSVERNRELNLWCDSGHTLQGNFLEN